VKKNKIKRQLIALLFCIALPLLASCELPFLPGGSSKEQLPDVAGYESTDGREVWQSGKDGVKNILKEVLEAGPELTDVAEMIQQVGICSLQYGGADWRIYRDRFAVGVLLIASKQSRLNPDLYSCKQPETSSNAVVTFCSEHYEFTNENGTFYAFYSGTTQQVCNDICNTLPDCPHK